MSDEKARLDHLVHTVWEMANGGGPLVGTDVDRLADAAELPSPAEVGIARFKFPVGLDGVVEITGGEAYRASIGTPFPEPGDRAWVFGTSVGPFKVEPEDRTVRSWTSLRRANGIRIPDF